jgi:transcription elongation factor GreA-like protein
MADRLVPGVFVRHPAEPDWGIGQVQSVIGNRVTVNFENAGKRLINSAVVQLDEVEEEEPDRGS